MRFADLHKTVTIHSVHTQNTLKTEKFHKTEMRLIFTIHHHTTKDTNIARSLIFTNMLVGVRKVNKLNSMDATTAVGQ